MLQRENEKMHHLTASKCGQAAEALQKATKKLKWPADLPLVFLLKLTK